MSNFCYTTATEVLTEMLFKVSKTPDVSQQDRPFAVLPRCFMSISPLLVLCCEASPCLGLKNPCNLSKETKEEGDKAAILRSAAIDLQQDCTSTHAWDQDVILARYWDSRNREPWKARNWTAFFSVTSSEGFCLQLLLLFFYLLWDFLRARLALPVKTGIFEGLCLQQTLSIHCFSATEIWQDIF